MLDTHARKYVNPIIELGAKFLLKLNLTPNNVTILALLIGVSTSIFLYFDMQISAVILLWVSGYLDAVDGAMARKSNSSSSFGTLLDIVSDRIVEVSIVLVLGLKFIDVRYNLIILTVCILMSMTIFFNSWCISEKKGVKSFIISRSCRKK